jgi:ketosteroid isomerase-like protein
MMILLFALSLQSPQAIARALVEKYDAAWMRKDAAGFAVLLSPDYVYFSSEGKVTDRKGLLEMLASPEYRIDAGSRDEFRTFVSGSVVVVSSRWRGRGSYNGKPFTDDQRCSVVIAVTPKPTVLAEHCTNLAAISPASPVPAAPMPR